MISRLLFKTSPLLSRLTAPQTTDLKFKTFFSEKCTSVFVVRRTFALSDKKPESAKKDTIKPDNESTGIQDVEHFERVSSLKAYKDMNAKEKVVEGTKDTMYLLVSLFSLSALLGLFYLVYEYTVATNTPSGVYNLALAEVEKNPKIQGLYGAPIKSLSDNRGRRGNYIKSNAYLSRKDGRKHLVVQFIIKGPHKVGTVTCDAVEKGIMRGPFNLGSAELQKVVAVTDDAQQTVIVVVDKT